ncbi:MAG: carboxylesterase family protein [Pseudomonadota bacterium]
MVTRPAPPLDPSPVIQINSGEISGGWVSEEQIVALYNGIPYAAPPVGDLRWRPPQDPLQWSGVRDGRPFGAECIQYKESLNTFVDGIVRGHGLNWFERQMAKLVLALAPEPVASEDCLFLNVRTANLNPGQLQPVMVWIHGGSHQIGSGSTDLYQANGLVDKGIVLVTINYRLGPFGYLAHPSLSAESPNSASGNYGLMDQIKALEWVEENIAAFGGDPTNVTIFGESAGAQSVSEIMASPLGDELYDKAILQSGSSTYNRIHLTEQVGDTRSAESVGQAFLSPLLPDDAIEASAAELRTLPAESILSRIPEVREFERYFLPNVDGYVLPDLIGRAIADGDALSVPILAGYNADEGTLFFPGMQTPTVLNYGPFPIDHTERMDQLERIFGSEDADTLANLYGFSPSETWDEAATDMLGDDMFGMHMRFLAKKNADAGLPTWLYLFSRTPPKKKQTLGAWHGSEIAFVFDSHIKSLGFTDADASLTDIMTTYWTNFAKTGDPNSGEVPNWPAYTAVEDTWIQLDHDIRTRTGVRKGKLDVLESNLLRRLDRPPIVETEASVDEQIGADALQP